MKNTIVEIEDKVDELITVLDRDIQHIEESLSIFNELRSLVVKRDDAALHELLENIQFKSNGYKENELKRQSLREELATVLECSLEEMTLSRLEAELFGEKKTEVTERRTKLQTLTGQLKKEHLSTSMLLSDCARFNSMLLTSVLELGQTGTITYGPRGSAERQINLAFVNLQS